MKLPHHRSDDGYVVWRGVVAAAGRLKQTRFPAEDMGAVKRHLANHFKEFDREAPWERDVRGWESFQEERERLEDKSSDPLNDEQLACLFDDPGIADEAMTLRDAQGHDDSELHLSVESDSEHRSASFDRDVLDVLDRVESRLKTIEGDEVVWELEDEDDNNDDDIVVDPAELAHAVRDALHDSVGAMVSAEMRSAINAARGRLD